MPAIFRYKGHRFFFYSNEGSPREPVHVHVESANGKAKFWLYPTVRLDRSQGYDVSTLRELHKVIENHRTLIEGAWNDYFS
jgi:hypothetical protein